MEAGGEVHSNAGQDAGVAQNTVAMLQNSRSDYNENGFELPLTKHVQNRSKKRERSKKHKIISKAKKQEQIIIKQELSTMKDIILRYLDIQQHKKNNGPA